MNELEAYILGYAYRLIEEALHEKTKIPTNPALCAVHPIKYLFRAQRSFLHQQMPDGGVVRFLYAMHRKFHFDTYNKEKAMLDEQLQWIWLMGYYMLDVDGYYSIMQNLVNKIMN